jgi:RHS repeat-associated protein
LTEYLNDSLSITGYSQVIKQTETNLETGEQANITYIIGRNRISQITLKDGTEQELYFTFDGHGSTRVLTDLAGAIVEIYNFDAYGNAIGFDPSVSLTEFLYSGEQFDSKIGQQYLRARYYDPATGRFNRLDPFFGNLNDPQSLHKYLYAHGDPINGIDPSGNMSVGTCMASIGIGMGIGAISGGIYGSLRYGFGTSGMWRSVGIGTVIGGLAGFGLSGLFSAYITKAGLVAAGGKILLLRASLGIISMYATAASVAYLVQSPRYDKTWIKMTSFTNDEAEYLNKLLTMMKTDCEKVNKHKEASYLYSGYFAGRSMEVDPDDPDTKEVSFTTGRWWTWGGKCIILSNDFFDRKPPTRTSFENAFESQVETLFHETYHHSIGNYQDHPATQIFIQYSSDMKDAIKDTDEYQNFYKNDYLPFVQNR